MFFAAACIDMGVSESVTISEAASLKERLKTGAD